MATSPVMYRLAQNPADYRLCHALLRASDGPEVGFGFPTVMGVRDNALVGFLGTLKAKEAIVAGPLVMDPTMKAPGRYALRLLEVYEAVLARAGVQSYIFGTDPANAVIQAFLDTLGLEPYATDPTTNWYVKKVL